MKNLPKRLIPTLGRIFLAVALGLTVGALANRYGRDPVVQIVAHGVSDLSCPNRAGNGSGSFSVRRRLPSPTGPIGSPRARGVARNELERVLDRLDEIPNPEMRSALRAVALRRWFDLDAKEAWAYATERAQRENSADWLVDAVFQWAELDGARAREALAKAVIPANWKTDAEISLVMAAALVDPEKALQLARRSWSGGKCFYDDLFGRLCARDLGVAANLAETMPAMPASARQSAILAVSAEWAQRDGSAALAWLQEQETNQVQAKLVVGMIWAIHDPEAVLAQLDALTNYPESRGVLMGKALFEWWKRDAAAAQDWFDKAELTRDEAESVQTKLISSLAEHDPESAADLSVQAMAAGFPSTHWIAAMAWAKKDPGAALAWAESLPAGESRDTAVLQICQGLMERDPRLVLDRFPELVGRFVQSPLGSGILADGLLTASSEGGDTETRAWLDTVPENVRAQFWKAYALSWGAREPGAALDHFSSQKPEKHLVEAAQQVISRWARHEPEAVSERIITLNDMEMRELATKNLLSAWLPANAEAAEAWAVKLTEPAMRDQAAGMLADHWSVADPAKSFTWANSVEDLDLRYDSIRGVVRKVALHDPELAAKFIERANLAPEDKERLAP
jgi:hypothetical protein